MHSLLGQNKILWFLPNMKPPNYLLFLFSIFHFCLNSYTSHSCVFSEFIKIILDQNNQIKSTALKALAFPSLWSKADRQIDYWCALLAWKEGRVSEETWFQQTQRADGNNPFIGSAKTNSSSEYAHSQGRYGCKETALTDDVSDIRVFVFEQRKSAGRDSLPASGEVLLFLGTIM